MADIKKVYKKEIIDHNIGNFNLIVKNDIKKFCFYKNINWD